MALTNWVIDRQDSGGSITVQPSTTTTLLTIAIPVDRITYIKAQGIFSISSGPHLSESCALQAECVAKNVGGSVTLITAYTNGGNNSANPQNSDTTAAGATIPYAGAGAQVADTSPSTLIGLHLTCVSSAGNVLIRAIQDAAVTTDGFVFAELHEVGYA